MKQAILIMAHKNLDQIERLINRLGKEFDIYLHLDKKMHIDDESISFLLTKYENLYLTKNRISGVVYAWPLVEITLELIKTAVEIKSEKKCNYSHFILISGQDYPIVDSNEIIKKLNESLDLDYINLHSEKDHLWIRSLSKRIRLIRYYYLVEKITKNQTFRKVLLLPIYLLQVVMTTLLGSPKKTFIKHGLDIYGGSAWWILSYKSIKLIMGFYKKSLDKRSNEYSIVKAYQRTIGPEESFFQTILMNLESEYIKRVSPKGNSTYIEWGGKGDRPISQDGHPYLLKYSDYEEIKNSNFMFARKFDINVDSRILDLLDSK